MRRIAEVAWVLGFGLLSTVLVVHSGRDRGATFDEPYYIKEGLKSWRTGSNYTLLQAGAMPLPIDVQTGILYAWERHLGIEFDAVADCAKLLPVARLGTLPFWWLLLASAYLWGRLVGGQTGGDSGRKWGGRFAFALTAFEPNLVAHAGQATTDIAACGTLLFSLYVYEATRNLGRWGRVVWPGLAYGVALSAKASAMPFSPQLLLVLSVAHNPPPLAWKLAGVDWREFWRWAWRLVRELLSIGLIGWALMVAYCGCDWAPEPSAVEWVRTWPEGSAKSAGAWFFDHLRVFPNGLIALVQQTKHNFRGHGSYVLGEYHPRAVWYYFPVVLSIKLPLVLAWLFVARLLVWRFPGLGAWRDETAATPEAPAAYRTPLWAMLGVLLLFSLNCRVQLGVRLVFILVALLLVYLGASWPARRGLAARGLALAGLMLLHLPGAPDPLRFTNAAWGGPEAARTLLADSNSDWGQGLPELARWRAANLPPDEPLTVWYYGADPACLVSPFLLNQAHTVPEPSPEYLRRTCLNGRLAIGHSLLVACPVRKPEVLSLLEWVKGRRLIGRTSCFDVYDINDGAR